MGNIMSLILTKDVQYPCSICDKNVRGNAKAVCCDICDHWVHINCNFITSKEYKKLIESETDETFYCNKCINTEMPFGFQNDDTFTQTNILGLNNYSHLENLNFKLSKTEQK